MLIEEARNLSSQIRSLQATESDASEAKRFSNRSEALKHPVEKIKTQVSICNAMRSKGVAVKLSIEPASLRSQLKKLRNEFHEDNDNILTPDAAMGTFFWHPLSELPEKLNRKIQNSWKEHIDSTISRFPEELVDAFAAGSKEWAELKDIYARIDSLRDKVPDVAAIDDLTTLANEESEAKQNLGADDELEELIPFVSNVKDGTATLSMVTEELKSLLEEKDLLYLFNVRLIEK